MKKIFITLLQLAVTIAVLYWVFHDPNKRAQMGVALRTADYTWIAIGIVFVAPDLRIRHLDRQVRLLSFLWLAVRILAASRTFTLSPTLSVSADETKVLRAPGIVIEDEKGTASPSFGGANTKDGRTQTAG